MKRFLPLLAAAILVGSAVACTDDKAKTAGGEQEARAETASTQTITLQNQNAPTVAAAAPSGSATEVVQAVSDSVVRVRAGDTPRQGAFGAVQSASEGTGTGFIVDSRGYIVTNNHVVTLGTNRAAPRIEIDLADGRTVEGKLVGRDERTDLAVIKVEAGTLKAVRFASPESVVIGQDVVAIGFALDLGSTPTVTKGVVSAKDRVIDETINAGQGRGYPVSISGAIQTDASINPGNSGGPLVNLKGEVVGVNTAGLIGSAGQPVQGIFFAVSSAVAEPIVKALIESGSVQRGYLGITLGTLSRALARERGLKVEEGAGVESVETGGAAERAGLRAGDVITKIGDESIRNVGDVSRALFRYRPGVRVKVEVARGSDTRTFEVTLGERPSAQ
jgi:S1-C subfamily serine protease